MLVWVARRMLSLRVMLFRQFSTLSVNGKSEKRADCVSEAPVSIGSLQLFDLRTGLRRDHDADGCQGAVVLRGQPMAHMGARLANSRVTVEKRTRLTYFTSVLNTSLIDPTYPRVRLGNSGVGAFKRFIDSN